MFLGSCRLRTSEETLVGVWQTRDHIIVGSEPLPKHSERFESLNPFDELCSSNFTSVVALGRGGVALARLGELMYGPSEVYYCIVLPCMRIVVHSQNTCREERLRALGCCSGASRKCVRLVVHVGSNCFESGHGRNSASHL